MLGLLALTYVPDNIERLGKAGTIFSSKFDRHKTNPLVHIKFWKQACLPSLLFGSELFTLIPSLSSTDPHLHTVH